MLLNFVLIHGSWHTGARWTPVVGHLHQAGHQAFAPTVLGHGEGVEKLVNHVQQVDDLVNQLLQRNLRDIVLVGHSYAGTLTARLAGEIPDRIRLCPSVPQNVRIQPHGISPRISALEATWP